MNLHINPHADQPIYRQIERQIIRAIADRQLRPGEPLLSEHELATRLVVSPTAVHKAYLELESAGLCTGGDTGLFTVTVPGLDSIHDERTKIALSWRRRDLLSSELETAYDFQQRLLPPRDVRRETFTVASRSYAAGTLTGDFYDLIESRTGGVDFIVADAVGKGLAAGLIMATTKSLLPLVADEATAGGALTALNTRLFDILNAREFVAMSWARLDPQTGRLQIANAGLPDPALLHREGRMEWIEVTGDRLPLGARAGSCYSTSWLELGPNDRLLLLTDGIPEAIDSQGQALGYRRLQQLIEEILIPRSGNGPTDTGSGLDHLLDLASRRTSSLLADDWTAMLVDYHPIAKGDPCSS